LEVIEQYFNSKTGDLADCEDAIFFNENFAAVIDGVTSKSARRWDGKTSGQVAARLVLETLPRLAPDVAAPHAFDLLNQAFRALYTKLGLTAELEKNPVERCAACVLIYSRYYRQLWSVGDCQALVAGRVISQSKVSDNLLANVRAFYLETELLLGKTVEELRENDTGRDFIFPLLQRERLFQNNTASPEYSSWVVDGFLDPARVRVIDVPPQAGVIVLASDGYPALLPTLDQSEKRLAEILARDPLLFREFKATKGLKKGQVSFDDRSYLRLRLDDPNRD
jgi:hypothetical protein